MYAELAIYQSSVRGTFHYAVPDDLPVSIGQLVEVSFRTGLSQAIVLDLVAESSVPHPKPILDVLSDEPVLTPLQIALGRWMADETFTALGPCLWMMLPPGLAKRGAQLYSLVEGGAVSVSASGEAATVLDMLRERGPLRARQIDRALPRSRWRDALKPLITQGVVATEAVLPAPEAKAQTVRVAWLKVPPDTVPGLVLHMRKSPKQAAVLNLLAREPEPVEIADITRQTGASPDSIRRLEAKGHIAIGDAEHLRDPLAGRHYPASDAPSLTPEQAACWEVISAFMAQAHAERQLFRAFLLHGVTGSGKTEIYLRAIDDIVSQGRQAIVLVPEIALVAPTVGRFASRFPGRIAVVHSALTDGEQYDTWRRARAGHLDIVIGARSALFTPLPDVGLIIIDEEHDDSYKQSPPLPPPYYHARETAMAMLRHAGGTLILGSATPDVATVFRSQQAEITYLRLPNRVIVPRSPGAAGESMDAISAPLPPVQIVDMREELREGNKSMFSRALRVALQRTLDRGEQALLFLNRRGSATFVLCRDCGYVSRCPNCDIPLTYHQTGYASAPDGQLTCHYCGHREVAPDICPQCHSRRIRFFGAGTAAVEQGVLAEFPGAQVLRWDRDTAQGRQQHEAIWAQFAAGEANVLVGTQMIVKGLDLPRVTLMGVVLADTALGLPDYRAGERTFQLLTQAAGRSGRGWRGGQVIFQTYQPEHYAIQAASGHDYEAFYLREIEYRRLLGYPPFKRLVRLIFRSPNAAQVQRDAENVARDLRQRIILRNLTATTLIGPAPAFFGKIDGVYQWHLIARTTDPARLLGDFDVRTGWQVDVDPVDIL